MQLPLCMIFLQRQEARFREQRQLSAMEFLVLWLYLRAELEAKFAADVADGVAAAAAGMVDDVIDPAETRKYVIAALEMLSSKRESNPPKKHGNLPL